MLASAVIDFGLSLADAGSLTINKYIFLADRHNLAQRLIDNRVARLCFVFSRTMGSSARFEDFLPGDSHEQTEEEMAEVLKTLTVALGGEIICN